jgi:hypothetical protein
MCRAVLTCVLVVGVAASAAAQSDPCRGADIRFEAVRDVCTADGGDVSDPDPRALSARIVADELSVRSGEVTSVRVELRNETDAPLELLLSRLGSFEVSLLRGDERVDRRWKGDGASGGLAARIRPARVVLEPGGVLWTERRVAARIMMLSYEQVEGAGGAYQLVHEDVGRLPPGDYVLRILLPLAGDVPIGEENGFSKARPLERPLRVDE